MIVSQEECKRNFSSKMYFSIPETSVQVNTFIYPFHNDFAAEKYTVERRNENPQFFFVSTNISLWSHNIFTQNCGFRFFCFWLPSYIYNLIEKYLFVTSYFIFFFILDGQKRRKLPCIQCTYQWCYPLPAPLPPTSFISPTIKEGVWRLFTNVPA